MWNFLFYFCEMVLTVHFEYRYNFTKFQVRYELKIVNKNYLTFYNIMMHFKYENSRNIQKFLIPLLWSWSAALVLSLQYFFFRSRFSLFSSSAYILLFQLQFPFIYLLHPPLHIFPVIYSPLSSFVPHMILPDYFAQLRRGGNCLK